MPGYLVLNTLTLTQCRAIFSPGFPSQFLRQFCHGSLPSPLLTVGRESHVGGVVPHDGQVQVSQVEISVFPRPEGELAEPVRVVHTVEQSWLADTDSLGRHSLVQYAGGGWQTLPLRLGQDHVDGHLLEVEEEGASVGSPAPLTGVRHLVTVSTPGARYNVRGQTVTGKVS